MRGNAIHREEHTPRAKREAKKGCETKSNDGEKMNRNHTTTEFKMVNSVPKAEITAK